RRGARKQARVAGRRACTGARYLAWGAGRAAAQVCGGERQRSGGVATPDGWGQVPEAGRRAATRGWRVRLRW
ncbi:unnamed protein product, partial [Urochloa humidicola]